MQIRTCVRRYPLRDRTLVTFAAEDSYDELLTALTQLLDEEPDAFAGPHLVVDVGARVLATDQLLDLEALIRRGLGPRVLQIVNGETDDILREDGVAAADGEPAAPPARAAAGEPGPAAPLRRRDARVAAGPPDAVILRRTIRSGQRITYDGSIVIIGDVNPGAEVIATGDVVVLGSLRGLAHAGARGRADARVIALRLEPVQLRIADCIGRQPDEPVRRGVEPEMARVCQGAIVVEPLAGHAERLFRAAGS